MLAFAFLSQCATDHFSWQAKHIGHQSSLPHVTCLVFILSTDKAIEATW